MALRAACCLTLLLACACATTGDERAESAEATAGWEQELQRVRIEREGASTVVTLVGLDEPTYRVRGGAEGDVLTLILPGVTQPAPSLFDAIFTSDREWPVEGELVERATTATQRGERGPRTTLEIRLAGPADYAVRSTPDGLVLRLTQQSQAGPRTRTAAARLPPRAAQAPARRRSPPAPAPRRTPAAPARSVRAAPPAPGAPTVATRSAAPTSAAATTTATAAVSRPPTAARRPATALTAVRVETTRAGILVHLLADGELGAAQSFTVPDPDRLVIDLPGLRRTGTPTRIDVASDIVTRVRLGVHPDKLRIVLDGGPRAQGFQGRRLQPFVGGLVVAVGSGRDLEERLAASLPAPDQASAGLPPVSAGREAVSSAPPPPE